MRRLVLIMFLNLAAGDAVADDERIVFPVPGRESTTPSALFFDELYVREQGVQHLGVDIPAPDGTIVVSPVDGLVVLNRTNVADPFSAYLVIRSEATGDEHVLAHIRSDLATATQVDAGTPVGSIVTAGTGPHLHYGINELSVSAAIDVANGWGFGRAPKSSTSEDALMRGWVDPLPLLNNSQPVDDMPASLEWGEDLVAGVDVGYMPCGDQRATDACLRRLGFSDEALAFSFAMDQDYSGGTVGVSFRELGAVDLAGAEFIGADVYSLPVLLNGSVGFHRVGQTVDLRTAFLDGTSQSMLRRFPNAFVDGMDIRSHRVLSDGTQRFVLIEGVVDGCRACDLIGSAVTFLEVGPATGGRLVYRPIGVLLGPPEDTVDQMTADLFFTKSDSLQVWLNGLGYEAGPMDGQPGQQTRQALREMQADFCLATTGMLEAKTAELLLKADGFDRPCAGAATGDSGPATGPLVSAPPTTDGPLDVSFSDACTTLHDSECYAVFEVRGLDPNGDGFLAVRTGPGTSFAMKDQIFNGDKVTVFLGEIRGQWYPILYGNDRKGWANRKWLYQISG
ncbi:MAG: peptidoglycan-binding protein [Sphingomonadaceae bacterium]